MKKQYRTGNSNLKQEIILGIFKGIIGLVIGTSAGFFIDMKIYDYHENKIYESHKKQGLSPGFDFRTKRVKSVFDTFTYSDPKVHKLISEYRDQYTFLFTKLGGLAGLVLGGCSVFGGERKKKHVPGEGEYEYPYY